MGGGTDSIHKVYRYLGGGGALIPYIKYTDILEEKTMICLPFRMDLLKLSLIKSTE